MTEPLTNQQLDEIDTRAAHIHEHVKVTDEVDQLAGTDVPALLAEVRRLRTELARRVQCNDCGAVGPVFTGDDGLAYLDPTGQIGHPAAVSAAVETGEEAS